MNDSQYTIDNQWNDFIGNFCWVCETKLEKHKTMVGADQKILKDLIEELKQELINTDIAGKLKEQYSHIVYKKGKKNAKDFKNEDKAVYFLVGEMTYFNGRVNRLKQKVEDAYSRADIPDEELDDAANSGKQVKGSAEKLIEKLWDWVKKLLEVLNEIIIILFATLA